MESRYEHLQHEDKIYSSWEETNAFNPDSYLAAVGNVNQKDTPKPGKNDHSKSHSFSIMMPPPNANNPLHIGHAVFVALEDILTRFHRMRGDDTLWLPGTDHAGIETQFLFEKNLKKEGKSRFDFDRDTLYQMVWDYVQENSDIAVNQLKKIGASADWSRFKFMLDPKLVEMTLQTFSDLHAKELIYRDLKLVNYCTKCGTGFSDLEVNHQERKDPLYYLKYGPFTIATARVETKFRDTALAVNPNDPRYKKYLGETMEIPGLLGPLTLTIIPDEGVDPEFGTGIMKVSPAHDMHDFELGKKFDLPVTPLITFAGRMDFSWYINNPDNTNPKYLERAEKYHGKKVAEARVLMVEDLKEDGLLIKADENYTHNVGTCYRCGTVLEPLPLPQFFVKVKPLVEPVLKALKKGTVKVHGAGYDKILNHWLTNLRDWNISRQIVWGIRFPVWYSTVTNPDMVVTFLDADKKPITGTIGELLDNGTNLDQIKSGLQSLKAPIEAKFVISKTAPGPEYLQETDTFDTWFSSGQWPVTTLHSSNPGDFDRFYPTSVMETGYDILPFWVMRMLILGMFTTGKVPFTDVYLHGLARDHKGQKMSKSKGNVINPLEIIEKYGADALRMALVIRSTPGLDKSVGEADFKAMRNFTNKIWNATRFVVEFLPENLKKNQAENSPTIKPTYSGDDAFYEHLSQVVSAVTQQLSDLKIGLAAETAYNEFWHWYCDQVIEQAKAGEVSPQAVNQGLLTFLKILHPFVPFITETLWSELKPLRQELTAEANQASTAIETDLQDLLIASSWPLASQ